MQDIGTHDMQFGTEKVSRTEIDEVSERLDERGVHRPIKEGLEDDGADDLTDDERPTKQ